ncbi:MAG: FHIPEP family type III secretion protein, partial [Candidatus Sericytochromatia bacterium]
MDLLQTDSQHALTRLVRRFGPERGALLFGEYCLLLTLGFDRFRERHTDQQLQVLAAALKPLALWPEDAPAPEGDAPEDPLWLVALTLQTPPLQLRVGMDLFVACSQWALAQETEASPTAWFEPSRLALAETLGFLPPELVLMPSPDLPSTGYRLLVAGQAVEEGAAYPGQDLILGPEDSAPPPLPYAWSPDPAQPGWIAWMTVGPESAPPEGLARLHWLNAICRHLAAQLPRHAARLLTTAHVQALLRDAEPAGYDHELERYVSVPELRLAFQALLDQRVPLRPMPQILEGLIQAILKEMSSRKLGQEEIERINRQLPFLPTRRLVALARQALGLPEEPPPRMAWPAPPRPLPGAVPAPDPALAARLLSLAELERQQRHASAFWAAVFRSSALAGAMRSGRLERWAGAWGAAPAHGWAPGEVAERLRTLKLVEKVMLSLERYLDLARPLTELARWLEEPDMALSPEAQRLLESPRPESWAWILQEPARLIDKSG